VEPPERGKKKKAQPLRRQTKKKKNEDCGVQKARKIRAQGGGKKTMSADKRGLIARKNQKKERGGGPSYWGATMICRQRGTL